MTQFWADWRFWTYMAAWLPYVSFVLLYATRSPWYESALGRSLLLSKTVIAALITHALLLVVFGAYPGTGVVRSLIVGGAIVAGWYQLATLLRIQREDRARERQRIR